MSAVSGDVQSNERLAAPSRWRCVIAACIAHVDARQNGMVRTRYVLHCTCRKSENRRFTECMLHSVSSPGHYMASKTLYEAHRSKTLYNVSNNPMLGPKIQHGNNPNTKLTVANPNVHSSSLRSLKETIRSKKSN